MVKVSFDGAAEIEEGQAHTVRRTHSLIFNSLLNFLS